MKRTRDQLRTELLAAAEEVIDELLEWHERSEAPTLTEIEDAVLDLRKRLGERMERAVIADQEAVHPVPGVLATYLIRRTWRVRSECVVGAWTLSATTPLVSN
jgi:hypothetical protein